MSTDKVKFIQSDRPFYEPIAIVGIGCRYPGGSTDPESFWNFLCDNGNGISEVPEDRWNKETYYDDNPDNTQAATTKWGGFIDKIDEFDSSFFDISPREATSMDPQQRILLELTYEAIQDANMTIADVSNSVTGVFTGVTMSDYQTLQEYGGRNDEIYAGTGYIMCIIANRVSHRFNLKGPSYVVDTACSSSLVAFDQACRSINSGECEMAFAAGVNIILQPFPFIVFSKANMLSPTGLSAAFDARANGFVRGEGAGVVVLKPLSKAIADGDRIYSVVRGSLINQDGRTTTLTAPNQKSQISMMKRLCGMAEVDPKTVSYVEAHGTGTPIGDPIEAGAIGRVFGKPRLGDPVNIGSVKTNIGHLESGAGIAGIIKTALVLHKGEIPPNRNFETPNPNIAFDALNIRVPTSVTPLAEIDGRQIAITNSFGYGGTNATAVMESYREAAHSAPNGVTSSLSNGCTTGVAQAHVKLNGHHEPHTSPVIVPLSAASETSLSAYAGVLKEAIEEGGALATEPLSCIASALAFQRDAFGQRAVVHAENHNDLAKKLALLAEGEEWPLEDRYELSPIQTGHTVARRKLVFTYTGQGSQWWAMGRRLLQENAVYRKALEEFDALFKPLAGWSVVEAMEANEDASQVNDSVVAQPTIIAVEIGLTALWKHYGIEPDYVLGHSLGEISAAHASGALSLEDTVKLIHHRSQTRKHLRHKGAIAAIGLNAEEIRSYLPDDGKVDIAAINGPGMVSISGDIDLIEEIVEEIHDDRGEDILARVLKSDTAWHSYHLDHLEEWFRDGIASIQWRNPTIPFISSVTGQLEVRLDSDYWWSNLRAPVKYMQAVEFATELGANIFLELGPHQVLSGLTAGSASACGRPAKIINSLHRKQDDFASITSALGSLFISGLPVRWESVCGVPEGKLRLPKYQWSKSKYWRIPEESNSYLFGDIVHPFLGRRSTDPNPSWSAEINTHSYKYLAEHTIQGEVLFPAAAYVEMHLAAARAHLGAGIIELENIKFHDALFIDKDADIMLHTVVDPEQNVSRIYSRVRDAAPDWILRSESVIRIRDDIEPPEAVLFDEAGMETDPIPAIDFYDDPNDNTFWDFGPCFKNVTRAWYERAGASSEIKVYKDLNDQLGDYFAHPAVFDSCLHIIDPAGHKFWRMEDKKAQYDDKDVYLPVGFRKVRYYAPLNVDKLYTTSAYEKCGREIAGGLYHVRDEAGRPLMMMEGMEFQKISRRKMTQAGDVIPAESYIETFQNQPLEIQDEDGEDARPDASGDWLIFADDNGRTQALADALKSYGATAKIVSGDIFDNPAPEATRDSDVEMNTDAPLPVSERADEGGLQTGLQLLLENFLAQSKRPRGIIFARSLSRDGLADDADTKDVLDQVETDVLALFQLGQALDAVGHREHFPDIWLATRMARHIEEDGAPDVNGLSQAPLVSMIRTIANECSAYRMSQIDLDDEALASPDPVVRSMLLDEEETEVVFRGDQRFVSRIERRTFEQLPAQKVAVTPDDDRNYVVTMNTPGLIDSVELREETPPQAGPDDAVIKIKAVGLNFRDVMAVTGLLPREAEEEAWLNLGLEYGAVIESVGENVTGVKAGDRVMGMGRRCLQKRMTVPGDQLSVLPDHISYEQAATIPSVFVTAHYALNHVGNLKKGDRVLIHVATGGVGLAAIQLARLAGAEIFATAGSEEKRQYLRDLGIEHVMSSRTLEFADQIMDITQGRGVDVVLNSLPDDYITKGLEILAPYGRFLEIGKRDVYADSSVGMRALRKNITFAVLDLAALGLERPDYMKTLVEELNDLIHSGKLEPLPHTDFSVSNVTDAFRFMSKARHIGKVVVKFDEAETPIALSREHDFRLSPSASYLLTGGTRGFGLTIAEWMSGCGAGKLVLASRSGIVVEDDMPKVEAMEARGTKVEIISLDVTDGDSVEAEITRLSKNEMPLKGIVHSAAVLDDGLLSQLTPERMVNVIRPKVAGAWNIHRALANDGPELDFLVSFSSTSQLVGSAGQCNYVAANGFLDAFSQYRHARGLPAFTVDWGALKDSGMVARNEALESYLESAGIIALGNDEAMSGLEQMMRLDLSTLVYAAINWPQVGRVLLAHRKHPRVAFLMASNAGGTGRIRMELLSTPQEGWNALLEEYFQEEIGRVLKVEASSVPLDKPLTEIGLDSLSSFELKNRIDAELEIDIPVSKFLQTPTIDGLTGVIVECFVEEMRALEAAADSTDQEQAGADGSMATDDHSAGSSERFVPSERQLELLAIGAGKMTSPAARKALSLSYVIEISPGLESDRLRAAISHVAGNTLALRLKLSLEKSPDNMPFARDGVPRLVEHDAWPDELSKLDLEQGELVRLDHASKPDGGSILGLTAHASASDEYSLPLIVREILSSYAIETNGTPMGATNGVAGAHDKSEKDLLKILRARQFDEQSPRSHKDRAFWYEVLEGDYEPLNFGARALAPAPVGMGRNQGDAALHAFDVDLSTLQSRPAIEREAVLLTAFARAVSAATGQDNFLIDRVDRGRLHGNYCQLIGPIMDEILVPYRASPEEGIQSTLDRVKRDLELAVKHRDFSLESCETHFPALLREAGLRPSQVSFSYIDAESDLNSVLGLDDRKFKCGRFEVKPVARSGVYGCLNDLSLIAAYKGAGSRVRIQYDASNVSGELVERIGRDFQEHLRTLAGTPAHSVGFELAVGGPAS